ncbi:DUF1573 domain-containing protein [Flavobacterium enshiense]|uniref:DUF1573 domain-containing protein n=1 Tax=Flavobacterium enshiense TaxID=1341165 RepID=UPI00345CE0EB
MKKTVTLGLLAVTLGLMSFSVNPVKNGIVKEVVGSVISWKSEAIEVGEIPQGTPKVIEFEFKNTGKTPVIITNVRPSCGCTASDYTKEPIAPGKSGVIKAIYNAAAKGPFNKTVTVTTNAEQTPKTLTFKGIVK